MGPGVAWPRAMPSRNSPFVSQPWASAGGSSNGSNTYPPPNSSAPVRRNTHASAGRAAVPTRPSAPAATAPPANTTPPTTSATALPTATAPPSPVGGDRGDRTLRTRHAHRVAKPSLVDPAAPLDQLLAHQGDVRRRSAEAHEAQPEERAGHVGKRYAARAARGRRHRPVRYSMPYSSGLASRSINDRTM